MVGNYNHKVPAPFLPCVLQVISHMATPRPFIHTPEIQDYQFAPVESLELQMLLGSHYPTYDPKAALISLFPYQKVGCFSYQLK